MRDHEFKILKLLKWNYYVPSVVDSLDVCGGRPALVLSPAADKVLPVEDGVRANRTERSTVCTAACTLLEHCHRADNIFKDENERIVLGDWSSAAESDNVYIGDHTPKPSDDLVVLVRSAYLMYTNSSPSDVAHRCQTSPMWRAATQYAADCDYDQLGDFFNSLYWIVVARLY